MSFVYYCACLLLAVLYVADGFTYKRVCYYTNWSQYRKGAGKFMPEDIDPFLCTHINYAFATMKNNKLTAYEWNDESNGNTKGMYERVNDLKKKNPKLKTMLSVGGWNFGTLKMTAMLKTRALRNQFARTSIKFLRDRNFDGLDLDFEYPGSRGSPRSDKQKFTVLLYTLKKAFIAEAKRTGKRRLLLTAAVSAGKTTIDAGYEVAKVARHLDFINLMSYDLHGGWEGNTGINAPLYSRSGEAAWQKQLNVAWAATYWVKQGCPSRKLVIGMATYGRAFKLRNPANNEVGARTTGAAPVGPFTGESGFYAYYEICKNFIQGNEWNVKWHNQQKVPYVYKGNVWVGYDNEYSLQLKVQWLKKKKLGGWMVWDFDLDDFTGQFCGAGKFPLIRRLNKALRGKTITTTTFKPTTHEPGWTPPSTTPTTTTTEKVAGGSSTLCNAKSDGFYPRGDDCSRFYRCISKRTYHFICPNGLIFDPSQSACEYPANVAARYTNACKLLITTTTAGQTTTTTAGNSATTTTSASTAPVDKRCIGKPDGFYPTKGDCTKFHRCISQNTYRYNCPASLYFDPKQGACNYKENIAPSDLAYCQS